MMAMDELAVRWQRTPRARQRLPFKPDATGIEIYSVISLYNQSYSGVDWHDALVLPVLQVQPEDVLR